MTPVIHFRSRLFDLASEPGNPINPIAGSSLLEWLRARAPADVQVTAPAAEDWGWYANVDWTGRSYMLGACAHPDDGGNHEWVLQLTAARSLRQRLLGQGKLTEQDPCFAYFHDLIASEPGFTELSIERGP